MGWKGALRSIEASARRMEREAKKREKELAKLQEIENASHEVEAFNNYINIIQTVHQECGPEINWESIRSSEAPSEPIKLAKRTEKAKIKYENYKPNFIDRWLKREKKKLDKLENKLRTAENEDEREHKGKMLEYESQFADWKDSVDFANKVISGVPEAYIEAIQELNPFKEIHSLGNEIKFEANGETIIAELNVNTNKIIPAEMKTLTKTGKLTVKEMPKGRFNELYQDHICSCALRVARELFALLPVELVIVNTVSKLLNSQTGHIEEQPILSVAIPRKILSGLNLSRIDPSDSMNNFDHKLSFKKSSGFQPIERLNI